MPTATELSIITTAPGLTYGVIVRSAFRNADSSTFRFGRRFVGTAMRKCVAPSSWLGSEVQMIEGRCPSCCCTSRIRFRDTSNAMTG